MASKRVSKRELAANRAPAFDYTADFLRCKIDLWMRTKGQGYVRDTIRRKLARVSGETGLSAR